MPIWLMNLQIQKDIPQGVDPYNQNMIKITTNKLSKKSSSDKKN